MESSVKLLPQVVFVLAIRCGAASYPNVPDPGQLDGFTIVRNKILKTALPVATANVRSHIECAILCTTLQWKCFGANVIKLGGDEWPWLCQAFWVLLPDLSRLEQSVGDLYLNPGREDYWSDAAAPTAPAGLSLNCMMCICRESGCESQVDTCTPVGNDEVCGPFRMRKPFWCDGRGVYPCNSAPQTDYETCAKEMDCSRSTFAGYMDRYKANCYDASQPACRQYSILASVGPFDCSNPSADVFWSKIKLCCDNHLGC